MLQISILKKKLDFQPKSSLYSALASPEPQLQRQLPYKSWLGALGPDCDLTPKIGHLQKNGNCIQSLDTALTTYTWKLFLASLDVDSLVTNIPLEKTINICVDNLHNDNKNPPNIPKHDFYNFLNIATKETFFMFNNNKYKKVDGVAMESLLGPAVDNIFICSFESK